MVVSRLQGFIILQRDGRKAGISFRLYWVEVVIDRMHGKGLGQS